MSDLTLDVSKDWLEEFVFLLNHQLVVKHGLHSLMISHLSKHGKSLQFLGILREIEHGLGHDDISFNLRCQIGHGRPVFGSLHFETIEHKFVADVSTHVFDVSHAHSLEGLILFGLKLCDSVFSVFGNRANRSSPSVHISSVLLFHAFTQVLKVLVFYLSLHTPVFFFQLLSLNFHVHLKLLSIVLKGIVNLAGDSDSETESLVGAEK